MGQLPAAVVAREKEGWKIWTERRKEKSKKKF